MKIVQTWFLALLVAAVLPAGAEPPGFFRISSTGATSISEFHPDGTLVWSNDIPGSSGRLQWAPSLPEPDNHWSDVHFFIASAPVMTVVVPLAPPPAGMVLIPAGSFAMGNATNVFSWDESWTDELPQHTVYISAFFMDQHHVTETLWDEVRIWGLSHGYPDLALGSWHDGTNYSKGPRHPIHLVTWHDAVKWCNARSENDGLTPVYYTEAEFNTVHRSGTNAPYANWSANGYRLPTEAEWEKAARGGVADRRFPWNDSNEIQHTRANYFSRTNEFYDTSSTRGFHPDYITGGTPYTNPVDAFAPNGYGLYDMAGNVYDWCWDWYNVGYYSSSPDTNPRGPDTSGSRMLRGGTWARNALRSRVSYRAFSDPALKSDFIGFRCVRGL